MSDLSAPAPAPSPESAGPAVRMLGVTKAYGSTQVLDGIDLDVERGEILVVIGASGSGKTTLLRCLVGLVEVDGGRIEIEGEPIVDRRPGGVAIDRRGAEAIRRRKLGMVFQSYNLFPHRTALENVIEAPVHVRHRPRKEAVADAERLL
jgi:ABC-type polar amino acid transport system ATPase subunit